MLKCSKCDCELDLITCDGCRMLLCEGCSGLSSSELRCIPLKKRKLLFLCDECQQGFKLLPTVLQRMDKMEKDLQNAIGELKSSQHACSNDGLSKSDNFESSSTHSMEEMLVEWEDRKRRSKNVIMTNVSESVKANKNERIIDEKQKVEKILKDIDIKENNFQVFRLGRFEQNRTRLIKVVFTSENDAKQVLINKKKLPNNVKAFNDQTPKQREYYNSVKKKLNEMIRNGDSTKIIKFVNSVPTIVVKKNM